MGKITEHDIMTCTLEPGTTQCGSIFEGSVLFDVRVAFCLDGNGLALDSTGCHQTDTEKHETASVNTTKLKPQAENIPELPQCCPKLPVSILR